MHTVSTLSLRGASGAVAAGERAVGVELLAGCELRPLLIGLKLHPAHASRKKTSGNNNPGRLMLALRINLGISSPAAG